MKRITSSLAAVTMLLVAACTGSEPVVPLDADRACDIAERAVQEKSDADADGVERQVERLKDLDGFDDLADDVLADFEVVEELLTDEDSTLDDVVDEVNFVLDCDIEVESAEAAVVTDPPSVPTTAVPDATTTETISTTTTTEAITTTTIAAPVTDAAPEAPATPLPTPTGEDIVTVSGDAAGSGPSPDSGVTSAGAIAAGEMTAMVVIPDAPVIDWSTGFFVDGLDAPLHGRTQSITYEFESTTDIKTIAARILDGVVASRPEGAYAHDGFRSSTRDTVSEEMISISKGPDVPSTVPQWTLSVVTDSEIAGIVRVEIGATSFDMDGPTPIFSESFAPVAAGSMGQSLQVGLDLGWSVEGWQFGDRFSDITGERTSSGSIDFVVDVTAPSQTIDATEAALRAVIGEPTFETIESDRRYLDLGVGEDKWTLRIEDFREIDRLVASVDVR